MKETNTALQEIHALASGCDRCGSCLLVCPLFAIDGKEAEGARGKVNAARALVQGDIAPAEHILATAEFCLLCGACTAVCASKIKTPEVMLKVRQHLAPLSAKQTALSAQDQAKREQAFHTLREAVGGTTLPQVGAAGKIAYFFGCTARKQAPTAAVQTVKALSRSATVELLDNSCCGLPALSRGDLKTYLETTKKNIGLYAEAETIICDCACCSDTLKKAAAYLADDPKWQEAAQAFSQKITVFSDYLVKTGYQTPKTAQKLTYHEPCRLGRGQGIKKAPRDLIRAAGEYVEMPGADVCCGGCPSFPTDYPTASGALLAQKQAAIEKTGASLVVTECHHCLVQLKKAAEQSGGKFQAAHISEIL